MTESETAARIALLRPIREEQLGTLTATADLKPGDRVAVATKLGRTVATGSVLSVDAEATPPRVLVKLDSTGVDQSQDFGSDLYQFYVLPPETESNLAEDDPVVVNPDLAGNTGGLPVQQDLSPPSVPIQVILPFLNYDLRWAVTVWDDIGHYGFERAMARHAIPDLAKQTIRSMLLDKRVITANDAITPEWVQAVTQAPTPGVSTPQAAA